VATLTIDSTYSRDVRIAPTAAGNANDGSDTVGVGSSNDRNYRTGIKFPLTDGALTGATITGVELIVNVLIASGVSADSWYVGPYNGDGAADPNSDTVTVQYGRCAVAADNYGTFTDFRTTGSKTLTLGNPAPADVEALIGATFSIGVQQLVETLGGAVHYIDLDETTSAAPPQLRLTYTPAGATIPPAVAVHHQRHHNGAL